MTHALDDFDISTLGPFKSATFEYWRDPTTPEWGGFLDGVTLHFEGDIALSVRVNPDTDEVVARFGPAHPSTYDASRQPVEVKSFP